MDFPKNFQLSEFLHNKDTKVSKVQELMLCVLAQQLQAIRDELGVPIRITSGYRDFSDYSRLVKAGYKPSITSDHFCGNPIRLELDNPKRVVYGEYYSSSYGAADIQSDLKTPQEIFDCVKRLASQGKIRVGQVILETQGGKVWVHVANNATNVFNTLVDKGYIPSGKTSFQVLNVT